MEGSFLEPRIVSSNSQQQTFDVTAVLRARADGALAYLHFLPAAYKYINVICTVLYVIYKCIPTL